MQNKPPSPLQAQSALAEVSKQADWGSRADRQFRPILLGIAAAYLLVGALVGLGPPRGGSTVFGFAILIVMAGGLAGSLVMLWRIRAYTRSGLAHFTLSVAAFCLWNGAVVGLSSATGWWGGHQPSIHFTVSAAVGALPLLATAGLIGRRKR